MLGSNGEYIQIKFKNNLKAEEKYETRKKAIIWSIVLIVFFMIVLMSMACVNSEKNRKLRRAIEYKERKKEIRKL